jgi:hypothetical protein
MATMGIHGIREPHRLEAHDRLGVLFVDVKTGPIAT